MVRPKKAYPSHFTNTGRGNLCNDKKIETHKSEGRAGDGVHWAFKGYYGVKMKGLLPQNKTSF